MSKIEHLTPEQESRIAEWRDKWTAIGLSTAPANRPEAERGIELAYAASNLKKPQIVWCGSPLSQGLTRAIVLDKKFRASIGDSVWASVGDSVGDSVGASVRDSVGASVGASVWASVGASVRASVRASVWDSVWASVWASVGASVRASVRASVWASVGASVGASVWASGYGQHDANWIAFYDFFRNVCSLTEQTEKLSGLTLICENAGWFIPHEKVCWIAERHNICQRDERGRLHCSDGPALAYPDGWAIYAWHGTRVSYRVIEHPLDLTVKEIQEEQNAEVRRVMVERYGLPRFLMDSGAKKLAEDEFGELYQTEIEGDEPLVMVKVMNSTPEPDGTVKPYFLRVNPELRPLLSDGLGNAQKVSALNAVASTFGMTGKQYLESLVEQT